MGFFECAEAVAIIHLSSELIGRIPHGPGFEPDFVGGEGPGFQTAGGAGLHGYSKRNGEGVRKGNPILNQSMSGDRVAIIGIKIAFILHPFF
jgi:hypothetical protein